MQTGVLQQAFRWIPGRPVSDIRTDLPFVMKGKYWQLFREQRMHHTRMTPILFEQAVTHNRPFIIRMFLLNYGTAHSYNVYKMELTYLLRLACERRHDDMVEVLLDHGISPNTVNGKGTAPILWPIRYNNMTQLVSLVRHGAKPRLWCATGQTPLEIAVQYRRVEIAVYLMDECGVDPTQQNPDATVPLMHLACQTGHIPMIQTLLDRGVSIEQRGPDNITPLHCAVIAGSRPVLECLLQNGADIHAVTSRGQTALHRLFDNDINRCPWNVEAATILLDAGIEPDAPDHFQYTPLWYACRHKMWANAKQLLRHGANPMASSLDGTYVLHLAGKGKGGSMINDLLEHGADINVQNFEGDTVVHILLRQWHPYLTKEEAVGRCRALFVECDLSIRNSRGETPLSIWE